MSTSTAGGRTEPWTGCPWLCGSGRIGTGPGSQCIDGSLVRPSRVAAEEGQRGLQEPPGHALGPSRSGFGANDAWLLNGSSLPLAVEVTAGRHYNSTCFERVMNTVRIRQRLGPRRWWPRPLARDRRYGFRWMRWWLRRQHVRAAIPQRSDQRARQRGRAVRFDRDRDRRRNVVERCVGWLKECRRIATRFEKLALNYLAMVKLAMIQRYLRILDSSDGA